MATIQINGYKYDFEPGETILEVARRNDIDIPTLCYLKGATPTGACRMCLVEMKGGRGPIASCSTPAAPNMEISTETQRIIDARKNVIEFLLISGNHNCAIRGVNPGDWTDYQQIVQDYDSADDICVAYGECQLQALAYKYQVTERTLDRIPTNYALEKDDPLIGRDFSRCILCGRCVQACNDIQVNNAISYGYRGNSAKVVAKGDLPLELSDCVHCGECIQVCPVGALFEQKNRFNSRMWEVEHVRTTCYYCGVGCQLDLQLVDGKIVKVTGVEEAEPNQGRLCVKGRFAFDFIHSQERLIRPQIRKDGQLTEVSWDEALTLITSKLNEIKEKHGADSIGCVVSTKNTNEDLFYTKKFFNSILETDNVTHFEPPAVFDMPYSDLLKAKTIVVVGSDITKENPVAAIFVKQAVKSGVKLIVVDAPDTKISKSAAIYLNDLSDLKKEIDGETLMIHAPGYDISTVNDIDDLKVYSLSRENNTVGAYFMDLKPKADFDLSKVKFLYSMGDNFEQNDSVEFLVVQDIFPNDVTKNADVILPTAVWVEYDGTYLSSDNQVNRVRKAVPPPGLAKPAWLIFKELAKKMGQNWDSEDSKSIWEKEIAVKHPLFKNINYDTLKTGSTKVTYKHDAFISGTVKPPDGFMNTDFHKSLCEKCEDLQEVVGKMFKEVE